MCWSIPAKIIKINAQLATVEITGIRKEISLALMADAKLGDYVLVHAGYAISKVDNARARFTIDFFKKGRVNA